MPEQGAYSPYLDTYPCGRVIGSSALSGGKRCFVLPSSAKITVSDALETACTVPPRGYRRLRRALCALILHIMPDANRILEWRRMLCALPDTVFLELCRIYLGEVSTPYNKHTLAEALGAFLRDGENRRAAAALLSDGDRAVLAAILRIPNCTFEALRLFFNGGGFLSELRELLYSLEERLLIYRARDENPDSETVFRITPYFDETVRAEAPESFLLYPFGAEYNAERAKPPELCVPSAAFLAALLSFVAGYGDVLKQDGSLKKYAAERLRAVFAADSGFDSFVESVLRACHSLELFRNEEGGGFVPDFAEWKSFAARSRAEQCAFFAASSLAVLSRPALQTYARILLKTAASVPETGATKPMLSRLMFLAKHSAPAPDAAPRERQHFQRFIVVEDEEDLTVYPSALAESGIRFGLFVEDGTALSGETVYRCADFVKDALSCGNRNAGDAAAAPDMAGEAAGNALSVDAAFSVTVFGDLSLDALVPLALFLDIVRHDTATVYEISRKSATRAFDAGLAPDALAAELAKHCAHPLPQALAQALADWHDQYREVKLYKGYVLRISATQAERLSGISRRIAATIAPGVYLLDFQSDAEAARVLKQIGVSHLGKVVTAGRGLLSGADFPAVLPESGLWAGGALGLLSSKPSYPASAAPKPTPEADTPHARRVEQTLETLDGLKISQKQRELLKIWVEHRLILNPSQLRAEGIKAKQMEASGMDFVGKVRVLEDAARQQLPVEITDERGETQRGIPLAVCKRDSDSELSLKIDWNKIRQYSVGHLQRVARIWTSVFREAGYAPY